MELRYKLEYELKQLAVAISNGPRTIEVRRMALNAMQTGRLALNPTGETSTPLYEDIQDKLFDLVYRSVGVTGPMPIVADQLRELVKHLAPTSDEYLLTEDEAARFLRLDKEGDNAAYQTLYRYRQKGYLRAARVGRQLLYPLPELKNFIENLLEPGVI